MSIRRFLLLLAFTLFFTAPALAQTIPKVDPSQRDGTRHYQGVYPYDIWPYSSQNPYPNTYPYSYPYGMYPYGGPFYYWNTPYGAYRYTPYGYGGPFGYGPYGGYGFGFRYAPGPRYHHHHH